MYRYKVLLVLTTMFYSSVSGDSYMEGGAPVFEHGTVETSSSEFEKGVPDYSSIDITDQSSSDFRPITVPVSDIMRMKYITSPSGEKINLMKTYFDPVTKQPYRYVMRKKLLNEDDGFLNAASKFISKLLGSYESGTKYRPEYEARQTTHKIPPSASTLHGIRKREVSSDYPRTETNWAPVYIINHNTPSNKQLDGKDQSMYDLKDKIKITTKSQNYTQENHENNTTNIEKMEEETKVEERSTANDVNDDLESLEIHEVNSNEVKEEIETGENANVIDENTSGFTQSLKILQKVFMNCKQKLKQGSNGIKHLILSMQSCVQVSVIKALDRMLTAKVIPFNDYIYLVRNENVTQTKNTTLSWNPMGKDLKGNIDFIGAVCQRMYRMLQTHSLQFRLWDSPVETSQARRRHHYRKAFPMMVAGYMMLSAFLVPLGFQFMAMIGGKALLLSKMALMMSMLGGFKKLLTPEQIYHALPSYDYHSGWHHRSSTNEQPSMTHAYSKSSNGGYNNLQRDYTQQTQHWIDPKSYSVYS